MRVLIPEQTRATPEVPRWSLSLPGMLVVACAYVVPLALLCLRLWREMQDGSLPLDGSAVLVRFIVVGLFAALFSRWCMHWMRRERK